MATLELVPGEKIEIPHVHPYYGGEVGVYEFSVGEKEETTVFSRPDEEPKIYFMLRPDDIENHRLSKARQFAAAARYAMGYDDVPEDDFDIPDFESFLEEEVREQTKPQKKVRKRRLLDRMLGK